MGIPRGQEKYISTYLDLWNENLEKYLDGNEGTQVSYHHQWMKALYGIHNNSMFIDDPFLHVVFERCRKHIQLSKLGTDSSPSGTLSDGVLLAKFWIIKKRARAIRGHPVVIGGGGGAKAATGAEPSAEKKNEAVPSVTEFEKNVGGDEKTAAGAEPSAEKKNEAVPSVTEFAKDVGEGGAKAAPLNEILIAAGVFLVFAALYFM